MTKPEIIFLVLFLISILPIVVYQCVKLGTFAWYKGRQSFKESEERRNG